LAFRAQEKKRGDGKIPVFQAFKSTSSNKGGKKLIESNKGIRQRTWVLTWAERVGVKRKGGRRWGRDQRSKMKWYLSTMGVPDPEKF